MTESSVGVSESVIMIYYRICITSAVFTEKSKKDCYVLARMGKHLHTHLALLACDFIIIIIVTSISCARVLASLPEALEERGVAHAEAERFPFMHCCCENALQHHD